MFNEISFFIFFISESCNIVSPHADLLNCCCFDTSGLLGLVAWSGSVVSLTFVIKRCTASNDLAWSCIERPVRQYIEFDECQVSWSGPKRISYDANGECLDFLGRMSSKSVGIVFENSSQKTFSGDKLRESQRNSNRSERVSLHDQPRFIHQREKKKKFFCPNCNVDGRGLDEMNGSRERAALLGDFIEIVIRSRVTSLGREKPQRLLCVRPSSSQKINFLYETWRKCDDFVSDVLLN